MRLSDRALSRAYSYRVDPVAFIEDFIHVNELGKPFELEPWQKRLLRSALAFDSQGRLVNETVLWSQPKKSGKTCFNALVTIWYAFTQDPPNECLILANDFEQARGRVFSTIGEILRRNDHLAQCARLKLGEIDLSNGTVIRALASDYTGEAGANHGFTSWDELWGYRSEKARRLCEELTPVPTRPNRLQLVTTYAGFHGESELLWEQYLNGVGPEEHADGRGSRLLEDLPVWRNAARKQWTFWDHASRLPWQSQEYLDTQREVLRPSAYARLHENRWMSAEDIFLTSDMWASITDEELRPALGNERSEDLFVGVDASTKHDSSAVVAVRWEGDRLCLARHRIWQPRPDAPLDIEATIEEYLTELRRSARLVRVLCDPYQLHRSITALKAEGMPIEEFPQTQANTTRMGQTLWDLVKGRNLAVYRDDELRKQALSTVALDTGRGWRIAKDKSSKKIDAIVALAMACVAAIESRGAVSRTLPVRSVARGTPLQNRTRGLFSLAASSGGRLSPEELGRVPPWERE